MRGRVFLDTARTLLQYDVEDCLRGSAGRAYYALFLEARDLLARWGIQSPNYQAHLFVRTRFQFSGSPELKQIGDDLYLLSRLRILADYETWHSGPFYDDSESADAIHVSEHAIARLDSIEADPAHRAAAIAAIRAIP